jgi:hypothetical protein
MDVSRHQPAALDASVADSHLAMPEQRHFLLQWIRGLDHSPQPPSAQRSRRIAAGSCVLVAVVLGLECRQITLGLQQAIDRLPRTFGQPSLALGPIRAESGTSVQMPNQTQRPGPYIIGFIARPSPIGIDSGTGPRSGGIDGDSLLVQRHPGTPLSLGKFYGH